MLVVLDSVVDSVVVLVVDSVVVLVAVVDSVVVLVSVGISVVAGMDDDSVVVETVVLVIAETLPESASDRSDKKPEESTEVTPSSAPKASPPEIVLFVIS